MTGPRAGESPSTGHCPLKAAVGVFLGQIVKNAADDLWKSRTDAATLPFSTLVENDARVEESRQDIS